MSKVEKQLLDWWEEELRNENYDKARKVFNLINKIMDRSWKK